MPEINQMSSPRLKGPRARPESSSGPAVHHPLKVNERTRKFWHPKSSGDTSMNNTEATEPGADGLLTASETRTQHEAIIRALETLAKCEAEIFDAQMMADAAPWRLREALKKRKAAERHLASCVEAIIIDVFSPELAPR